MSSRPYRLVGPILSSAMGLALLTASAQAETVDCTAVTVAPFTISTPGVYCLTADLFVNLASGNAITITASNVVLDLNGFRLANQASGTGTGATGIYATQRQGLTIKNGTVRGFLFGISIDDLFPYTNSQGNVVEDIHAVKNTYAGISVLGRQMVIRHNHVESTGGTTFFPANAPAYGIQVYGPGNRVLDNDVTIVSKTGNATAWGIYFASSSDDGLAVNNRIAAADTGLEITTNAKFRDNLTIAVGTPFVGGTNAGNNN